MGLLLSLLVTDNGGTLNCPLILVVSSPCHCRFYGQIIALANMVVRWLVRVLSRSGQPILKLGLLQLLQGNGLDFPVHPHRLHEDSQNSSQLSLSDFFKNTVTDSSLSPLGAGFLYFSRHAVRSLLSMDQCLMLALNWIGFLAVRVADVI